MTTFQHSLRVALDHLKLWKAVRPQTFPDPILTALYGQGLVETIPTVLGQAAILSPEGCSACGVKRRPVSDTVAVNALYRQDARSELSQAGFQRLRPGQGIFSVVNNAAGQPCPVLGRVTAQGYTRSRVREILKGLETDLILARADLIVITPVPVTYPEKRVVAVYSEPRWHTSLEHVQAQELGSASMT